MSVGGPGNDEEDPGHDPEHPDHPEHHLDPFNPEGAVPESAVDSQDPFDPDGTDGPTDPTDPLDPFAGLTLDEDFVSGAVHAEPSAAQRERARRQQDLARRLADEELERQKSRQQSERRTPDKRPRRRLKLVTEIRSWLGLTPPDDEDSDRGVPDSSYSPHPSGPSRPHRSLGQRASAIIRSRVFWIVVAIILAILALDHFTPNNGSDAGVGPLDSMSRPADWPKIDKDRSRAPLGTPAAVPAGGGSHKFLHFQRKGETPVAYDPCRQIHYVTSGDGPANNRQMIRQAIAQVSKATGLVFVDDGVADESPSEARANFQPDRYGDRWAPVLIAWSDPVESPRLGEVDQDSPLTEVAGYAGSQAVAPSTLTTDAPPTLVYVTGSVVLDAPDFAKILSRPDGEAQAIAVIMHELGHLVGLDHVDDQSQIMFPKAGGVTTYQPGDLEGLATLGRGKCMPGV